jgi:hypothetical protein
MIRKQLDAEPQPVRPSREAPNAIDQREPAALYLTRRGSRSLLHKSFTLLNSVGDYHINRRRLSA